MATAAPFFSAADPIPAQAAGCAASLQTLLALLGRHFARSETRAHLGAYLAGMLSPIERKNGWHLAEQAEDATTRPSPDTTTTSGAAPCSRSRSPRTYNCSTEEPRG